MNIWHRSESRRRERKAGTNRTFLGKGENTHRAGLTRDGEKKEKSNSHSDRNNVLKGGVGCPHKSRRNGEKNLAFEGAGDSLTLSA